MGIAKLDAFMASLDQKPTVNLFNPWFESDLLHDKNKDAFLIRRKQLYTYLEERIDRAKYVLIAEALGYQGGHFTGIAMTSERILLNHQKEKYWIDQKDVFSGMKAERTSREEINTKGMSEPTATIVWGTIKELGVNPYDVVLWNAVPWHPYNPHKGLLSNRTPNTIELEAGLEIVKKFLALWQEPLILAIGKKSEACLQELELTFHKLRHPANGGGTKFRHQFKEIVTTKT